METNILDIHEDGLEISLMDGSRWQVLGDVSKTAIWYSPQRIEIEQNDNGEVFLINHETYAHDKVKVSRIS